MTQKTSLLSYSLVMLLISFINSNPCQAASSEFQIIQYIVEESKKERDLRDNSHVKEIADFSYEKAKEFAKQNHEFARDIFDHVGDDAYSESQSDEDDHSVDIVKLDENNYLINLSKPLEGNDPQYKGCLFVINPTKPNWTPAQLEAKRGMGITKSYSFITDFITYRPPLLLNFVNDVIFGGGVKNLDIYIFKNGTFKLIRSQEQKIDEEKAEGVTIIDDTFVSNYLKTEVYYIDNNIHHLYKKFASKAEGDLKNPENWTSIYFVKMSKAFFHEQPDDKTKSTSYLVWGDAIYVSETRGSWILASYLDPKTNKTTSGWIKLGDVLKVELDCVS